MKSSVGHRTVNRPEAISVQHDRFYNGNTMINGGVFNHQTHTHTHTHFTGTEERMGMRRIAEVIAPGAFHNSAERYDPPKCHPQTRKAVLKKIMDWVYGFNESERRCFFMWLYGPAGAGKSAIAQTIAELCYELKFLAASFFFSRTAASRNDHFRLIATLTYQLCLSIPEIRTYVEDTIEHDPNIFSLSLETQLQKLIIEPLTHFRDNLSRYCARIHPMLIIIDGLDECSSAVYVQRCVLQTLAKKLPIPFFFLVASRPEPYIRGFFTAEPMASITTTLALDDSYLPDVDIKVFVEAKFDAIKRCHPLSHRLPESWPSEVDVDRLVRKSSGQFIYASTVMNYVKSPRHWPTDRLAIIFGIMNRGKDTPFAALDALYSCIFSFVEDINKVLDVFQVLLLLTTKHVLKSPALIEDLLGLRRDDLTIALIDLHSILDIPSTADGGEIRVLHASLGDFLLDQTRSGDYHINQRCAHTTLARRLLRCLPQKVTRDPVSELQMLSSTVITIHCAQSYPSEELLDALWSFNTITFLTSVYEIPPKASRASQMLEFFTWLKNNGSTKEGLDLYSHYMLAWDWYMQHSLRQLSLEPHDRQYIVFFILPQFRSRYDADNIFTWSTFRADHESLTNISSVLEYHDGDCGYDLLLTEFFCDPSRSGPFYVDGNQYASFSITFTKYFINRLRESSSDSSLLLDSEQYLHFLSVLLSKAFYRLELATLLNLVHSRLEHISPGLAQKAAHIIRKYHNCPQFTYENHYGTFRVEDRCAVDDLRRKSSTTARSKSSSFATLRT